MLVDEASREGASTDFGRIGLRKPTAVIRPTSSQNVVKVMKVAVRNGLSVSTRGGGHSQSGQSLSEQIVLDMSSLNAVGVVNLAQGTINCQSGLRWRALVQYLAPQQLSPPVLTNNLDVTVGDTLLTAGLGVIS